MHAKVIVAFQGRIDSEVMPRQIEVGELIHGDLAAVAVREKWAKEVPPNEKPDVEKAPAKKAAKA